MQPNGEQSSHIPLGNEAINLEHPSLIDIPSTQIERTQLVKVEDSLIQEINEVLKEVYPGHKPFQPKPGEVPHYETARINGKESDSSQTENTRTAYVLFTGNSSSADNTLQAAAEVYKLAQNNTEEVAFSATVGSSNSVETANTSFSKDPVERGIYQAINLMELLKNNPSKNLELVISSQSLGSMDLLYAWPVMEKLIERQGLDPKKVVKGLILFQPAGISDQPLVDFMKNTLSIVPDTLEREDRYPTEENIANFDVEIEKATTDGDGAKVFLLKERQKKLVEQRNTLRETMMRENPGITDEEIQKKVNEQVATDIIQGAKQNRELLPNKRTILMALATLPPWVKQGNMIRTISTDIRAKIDVPIAVVVTEQDKLFPDALKSMNTTVVDERIKQQQENPNIDKDNLQRESQFFPNAPQLIEATVPGLPHKGYGAEPQKFADIISRVKARFTRNESNDQAGNQQQVVKLYL